MTNCKASAVMAAILGILIASPAVAHPTGDQQTGVQPPAAADTTPDRAMPGYGNMPMYGMHHGMSGDMPMYQMHQQMHGAGPGSSMPMYYHGPHAMHGSMPMWGSDEGAGAAAPSGQNATKPDTK